MPLTWLHWYAVLNHETRRLCQKEADSHDWIRGKTCPRDTHGHRLKVLLDQI